MWTRFDDPTRPCRFFLPSRMVEKIDIDAFDEATAVPAIGPRMGCTSCRIVNAYARLNSGPGIAKLGSGASRSSSPAARATGMRSLSIRRRSGSGPSMPLGGSDKTAKIAAAINARDKRQVPQSAHFPLRKSSFLSRGRHATFCCLINLAHREFCWHVIIELATLTKG